MPSRENIFTKKCNFIGILNVKFQSMSIRALCEIWCSICKYETIWSLFLISILWIECHDITDANLCSAQLMLIRNRSKFDKIKFVILFLVTCSIFMNVMVPIQFPKINTYSAEFDLSTNFWIQRKFASFLIRMFIIAYVHIGYMSGFRTFFLSACRLLNVNTDLSQILCGLVKINKT